MNGIDKLAKKIFLHFKEKENRSYPLLLTVEQIKKELIKIYRNPNVKYILDEDGNEINGFCSYYTIDQEKYLQTTIFVSFNYNKEFVIKVLNRFKIKYPGYTYIIGIEAENNFISNALRQFGYKLVDDLYSTTIKLANNKYQENFDIKKVDLLQWKNYEKIHEKYFGEGYWNFERIKDSFDSWIIFGIKEKEHIKAYIFIKNDYSGLNCEIFGIYGNEIDIRLKLIKHAMSNLKNKKILYYFIEDYNEMLACEKMGFKIRGHYQAWRLN